MANNYWEQNPTGASILQERCIEEELVILRGYGKSDLSRWTEDIIQYLENRRDHLKKLNARINDPGIMIRPETQP